MSTVEQIDVQELLRDSSNLMQNEIDAFIEIMTGPQSLEFRQEVRRMSSDRDSLSEPQLVRAGVSAYLLGQLNTAEDLLSAAPKNGLAAYYRGLVELSRDNPEGAEEMFDLAEKNGYDKVACVLEKAGAVRLQGRLDDAEQLVRSVGKDGGASRADYSFQMGCIWSDRGDTQGAFEYFERAVDMDPHHSRALFWLAGENSRQGNDEEAIRLYEQSLSRPPYFSGALLNLGILYEDGENYKAAEYCFQRILTQERSSGEQSRIAARAEMFLKDVEATKMQFYDEEAMKREARMEQLLKRPISDFELSVRSRNCLENMGLRSLGDLTRISENELLAGKNFGETSLQEIRALVEQHNLKVGQNLHQAKAQEAAQHQEHLAPEEQAKLGQPISELDLSVRARKCMNRLQIGTVGELIQRTPDELLGSRNFGVTSLNEIRGKLGEMGLHLRNDKQG